MVAFDMLDDRRLGGLDILPQLRKNPCFAPLPRRSSEKNRPESRESSGIAVAV
jgi:hypothetical protein